MRSIDQFLSAFRLERRATRTLVAALPDEHFGWRPAPDAFSCGELVRHMMQAEAFWRRLILAGARGESHDPFGLSGNATARLSAFRPRGLASSASEKLGTTVRECLDRWDELQRKTESELAAIPPEAFDREVDHPLVCLRLPLWQSLWMMLAHEVHHRGQLSAYLKILQVPQPPVLYTSENEE